MRACGWLCVEHVCQHGKIQIIDSAEANHIQRSHSTDSFSRKSDHFKCSEQRNMTIWIERTGIGAKCRLSAENSHIYAHETIAAGNLCMNVWSEERHMGIVDTFASHFLAPNNDTWVDGNVCFGSIFDEFTQFNWQI